LADLIRVEGSVKDAILTIIRYVQVTTGVEPTQDEIAEMLKSYFILNEVGNQVKYQLKKASKKDADTDADDDNDDQLDVRRPLWTLNLLKGPGKNVLARAGVFTGNINTAIQSVREFIKKSIGVAPSDDILAKSLKSSFILSEIKNHIEWQRKNAKKNNETDDDLLT
jgi:hypothetical protein